MQDTKVSMITHDYSTECEPKLEKGKQQMVICKCKLLFR